MKIRIEFEYGDPSQYKDSIVSLSIEGMPMSELATNGDFRDRIAEAYVALTFPENIDISTREKWVEKLSGLNTIEKDSSIR